ncbi:MAG: hypothetical protein FJ115_00320 [Deltaproteobacteria bacterium]|nr:hypothetical protein [Deltaproteobacteria bacterium]MBM4321974.1 hypothetical protein [Deltaproteobacteria bacterium]
MKILATFKAKYLENGHLSITEDVASSLLLRKGEEVQVVIGKESFDKREEEIHIHREIVKEREGFGRGENHN